MFVPILLVYLASSPLPSGRSCLSLDDGTIAVTNLFDGVDWYNLANQRLVDSFRMTIEDNVITPILSNGMGSLIIGGSCGAVQVLQPSPAIVVQTLGLEGEWHRGMLERRCLKPIKDGKIVQALASAMTLCFTHRTQTVIQGYTTKSNGSCLLAAGTSELGSRTVITVWRFEPDRSRIAASGPKVRNLSTTEVHIS